MKGNDEFEYFNDEWNIKNNKVMIREKQQQTHTVIDLTGPQGNAYFLLGSAKKLAKQLDFEDVDGLLKDMQSGDYEHLVQVFDDHFGDFIILER
jgi:hypothetical protein|tara:strand:+ start:1070 stop:1351 length:282 start_codon:yes stop_codon:yes gene_type:complete